MALTPRKTERAVLGDHVAPSPSSVEVPLHGAPPSDSLRRSPVPHGLEGAQALVPHLTGRLLEAADVLLRRFDVVGTVETFAESAALIGRNARLRHLPASLASNPLAKLRAEDGSSSEAASWLGLNRCSMRLYETWARRLQLLPGWGTRATGRCR